MSDIEKLKVEAWIVKKDNEWWDSIHRAGKNLTVTVDTERCPRCGYHNVYGIHICKSCGKPTRKRLCSLCNQKDYEYQAPLSIEHYHGSLLCKGCMYRVMEQVEGVDNGFGRLIE